MKPLHSRLKVLFTRLPLIAAMLLTASSALAYNFTYSKGSWYITCNNGKRGFVDGPIAVGQEGDTGYNTVHGIAYNFCAANGGLQGIDECPAGTYCEEEAQPLPVEKSKTTP